MKIYVLNNKIKIQTRDYILDNVNAYWSENDTLHYVMDCSDIEKEYTEDGVIIKGTLCEEKIIWEMREKGDYITSKLTLKSEHDMCINKICALHARLIPAGSEQKFLRVPFDNDDWVRFVSKEYDQSDMGFGVGAVYGAEGALVIGALDYDVWKTGIIPGESIEALSGVTDKLTRDKIKHGTVKGKKVSSPMIYIGINETWQEGMTRFAQIYEQNNKRLTWKGTVPFGWNSWYAYMKDIDKETYICASDFIAKTDFNDKGTAYINFDAFWNNLTHEELADAAQKVREKGQKPGIYIAPFAGWIDESQMYDYVTYDTGEKINLEGFENIRYYDIILKDYDGEILPLLDGGYPLDVTHPVVLERLRYVIKYLGSLGYEYIKVDFLGHSAVEGNHYNKDIQTGMMAYNFAMQYLMSCCTEEGMFISLSIAPLFPGGYGHARRICCDVFQEFKDTEYLLNAITYGFWQNKRIYEFTDPDHICFNGTYMEAKSRFVSALAGGTLMLMSNNVTDAEQNERIHEFISDKELLDIAREHITFIPVEESIKGDFASVFVSENKKYIIIFNMSDCDKKFNLSATGVKIRNMKDLFSKKKLEALEITRYTVNAKDCAVLRILE